MSEEKYSQNTPKFVPKQFAHNKGTGEQSEDNNPQKIPFLPPAGEGNQQKQNKSFVPSVKSQENIANTQKPESSQKIKLNFEQESGQSPSSFSTPKTEYNSTQNQYSQPESQKGYNLPLEEQHSYSEPQYQTTSLESDPDMLDVLTKVEEVLTQLRSHSLNISKLKKEFKEVSNNQVTLNIQQSIEDVVMQIRTNSLYLSKIDRKYGELSAKNEVSQVQEQMFEQLLALMRTNNLYISKLERRIIELEKTTNSNGDEELLQQVRSHNLHLSKIDKKTNEILQVNQAKPTDDTNERLQTIEKKLADLLNSTQESQSNHFKVTEQKLNALMNNGQQEQAQKLQAIEQKLNALMNNEQEQKLQVIEQKLNTLMNNDQSKSTTQLQAIEKKLDNLLTGGVTDKLNGLQQQMEQIQTEIIPNSQASGDVGGIINEIITQLKDTNQQLSGIESKMVHSLHHPQSDEALKVNLKDNKLQLIRLEQQITELLKQTNKL